MVIKNNFYAILALVSLAVLFTGCATPGPISEEAEDRFIKNIGLDDKETVEFAGWWSWSYNYPVLGGDYFATDRGIYLFQDKGRFRRDVDHTNEYLLHVIDYEDLIGVGRVIENAVTLWIRGRVGSGTFISRERETIGVASADHMINFIKEQSVRYGGSIQVCSFWEQARETCPTYDTEKLVSDLDERESAEVKGVDGQHINALLGRWEGEYSSKRNLWLHGIIHIEIESNDGVIYSGKLSKFTQAGFQCLPEAPVTLTDNGGFRFSFSVEGGRSCKFTGDLELYGGGLAGHFLYKKKYGKIDLAMTKN